MKDYILNRFKTEIEKAFYSMEKYDILSTFALLHHEDDLEIETLSHYIRVSDKLLKVDAHTYFIIFSFTSPEHTYKAIQNLLLELDNHFNNRTSCIAMLELDPSNSPTMAINKLFTILEETKKHSYSRIEDESILNATF